MTKKLKDDEVLSQLIQDKMDLQTRLEGVEDELIPYKERFQDSILELDDLCENINTNIDRLQELEYDDMEYTDDEVLENIELIYNKLISDSKELESWLKKRKKIRDSKLIELQKEYTSLHEKIKKN